MVLRALHLCSGYGGFDLALRLAGVPARTVAHVERDSYAAATLVWRGWKTRPWIWRLSGLTSPPSIVGRGVAEWISSLPGFRVSRSAKPDPSVVLTTTAGSGQTLPGSLLRWDRDSSGWRTSPNLFDSGYLTFSPILPHSGSMRNGVCIQRPPLVPPIDEPASGSWPTATATDAKRSGGATANDVTLTDAGHHSETTEADGKTGSPLADLNPRFVESLMGLPQGWLTPSTSVATDSFRRWLRTHSLPLPSDSGSILSGDAA